MYYNYYQATQHEYDECVAKGICSIDPIMTSLQEVILLYLKELSYYLLNLRKLGVNNEKIKEHIIDELSIIVTNAEYNQDQFHQVMAVLSDEIHQAKDLYVKLCQKHNIDCVPLKIYFKHSKNFSLSEAIRRGEKHFLKRNANLTAEQKNMFDIMLFLLKSLVVKVVKLRNFEEDYDEAYSAILSMLNVMLLQEFSISEIKGEIGKFIDVYYDMVRKLHYKQIKTYGEMKEVEVSFSTRPGKAILVAGVDLKELELVLKATEKQNIDVYTHGVEMLVAHTFPKLKAYNNLVGHFGTGVENCLIDFATFPGPILMTKHTLHKVEYLYRGRLFTTDLIPSRGVVRLDKNNLEPLLKAAIDSKGFSRGMQKPSLRVGFSEQDVMKKVNSILDKIEKNEIKHLFIVGLVNYAINHKQYFDKFFGLVPKDTYIISLGYDRIGENIFHVNSFYDYSLVYKILKEIKKRIPLNEMPMSIHITKCDKHTIVNALNLKNMGVKNVYMCKCPPTLVNPALIDTLRNVFDINEFTSYPKEDLEKSLGESIS